VQRGHQQALETFPSFMALSLVGGLRHPALTTLAGAAWIIGRMKWAEGYAEGGPEARYGSQWSRFIWYSLICTIVLSGSTSLGIAGVL
jgi:glutathione S-transferase